MKMTPWKAAMGLSLTAAVTGVVIGAGQSALAQATQGSQGSPVVLELYTSQGCSSCPAADALLDQLADDPSLLPLALHVDYWDYIGWADTFAHPHYTDRQKAYARAAGERMIYTPQMSVGGVARVEGNDPEAVSRAIADLRASQSDVRLQISREGNALRIRAESVTSAGGAAMTVQLVRFQPEAVVEIGHGENAGKTVTYRNIVQDWQALAEWPGSPALDLLWPGLAGGDANTGAGTGAGAEMGPVAVLLQRAAPQGGPGEIVAAARLDP